MPLFGADIGQKLIERLAPGMLLGGADSLFHRLLVGLQQNPRFGNGFALLGHRRLEPGFHDIESQQGRASRHQYR